MQSIDQFEFVYDALLTAVKQQQRRLHHKASQLQLAMDTNPSSGPDNASETEKKAPELHELKTLASATRNVGVSAADSDA